MAVLVMRGDLAPTPDIETHSRPHASPSTIESTYANDSPSDVDAEAIYPAALPAKQQLKSPLRQLVDDVIEAKLDSSFRDETARKSQWQRSRSVVFERPNDFSEQPEEPIISDFQFKPEIHVAGLGLTIGSCFVGIPLVGIPVEERTVAFRPLVCAKPDS